MIDLNDTNSLQSLDQGKVAETIKSFPNQVKQTWEEVKELEIPAGFSQAKNIVVVGMGGSTIGVDVLKNLFKERLTVPLVLNRHYNLPNFVNKDSLVLLISYSGTTEEVLAAAQDAKTRKAKIIGITQGGSLAKFLKENDLSGYIFDPVANPSNQPRLGLGYTSIGAMGVLAKLGFLKIGETEVAEAIAYLNSLTEKLTVDVSKEENQAKTVAERLFGKQVFIVAGEHLAGNAHVLANQINENSKNFATFFIIPELNHHLLEGLTKPEKLRSETVFIFLESDFYSEKIKQRVNITKEVLGQQKIESLSLKTNSQTKLIQALEAIVRGSWVSFYLGILNGVDAAKIPWVDYFKKRLAES